MSGLVGDLNEEFNDNLNDFDGVLAVNEQADKIGRASCRERVFVCV